jgi:hypothetical protein
LYHRRTHKQKHISILIYPHFYFSLSQCYEIWPSNENFQSSKPKRQEVDLRLKKKTNIQKNILNPHIFGKLYARLPPKVFFFKFYIFHNFLPSSDMFIYKISYYLQIQLVKKKLYKSNFLRNWGIIDCFPSNFF